MEELGRTVSRLADSRVRLDPIPALPPLCILQTVPGLGCLGDLSLPLYFWVSRAGGLGVFLPPGVCLRPVSLFWPRLNQKSWQTTSYWFRKWAFQISTVDFEVVIYDIRTEWIVYGLIICDVGAWGLISEDHFHRLAVKRNITLLLVYHKVKFCHKFAFVWSKMSFLEWCNRQQIQPDR